MVSQAVVDEAVRRAAQTARLDVESGDDDAASGDGPVYAFDRAALERVSTMYRNLATQDDIIRAWHRAIRDAITRGDLVEGQALVALQSRLRGQSDLRYTFTDEGMVLMTGQEPAPEDDPWLADRNYFG